MNWLQLGDWNILRLDTVGTTGNCSCRVIRSIDRFIADAGAIPREMCIVHRRILKSESHNEETVRNETEVEERAKAYD